jgi:hypothetical protein
MEREGILISEFGFWICAPWGMNVPLEATSIISRAMRKHIAGNGIHHAKVQRRKGSRTAAN